MYLESLTVSDFRSWVHARIDLAPGVNTLLGRNGQGKTNLVEAVGYLATLASHRAANDTALVRHGASQAVVRGTVVAGGRRQRAEIEIHPGRSNRARLGGVDLRRPRDLLGTLRAVTFAPEDLTLVKGDPAERRRFLDELLVARAPRYAAIRADYDRVLRQRNALLKSAGELRRQVTDLATLDVWDAHLAAAGAELLAGRLALVDALRPLLAKAYAAVSGGETEADLRYLATPEPAGATDLAGLAAGLATALAGLRSQELQRGVSLAGPHRDELLLTLDGQPVRGFASHGESWSVAVALRLAAYELLRADGEEPVLILDDVFAELDAHRRRQLADLVAGADQVLITAAAAEDVPGSLSGVRFSVADGQVSRVG